jgi:hypothetical protein
MKLKALSMTAVAVSVAALVAACGGGGDGAAATSGVQLSGVAATGLALANSPVDVKCASGTGTATTNESGGYTVTVTDGALPCIVKVTGTVNGAEVTLHSLAQGSGTTATANVTPLTEMILARATGTLPADLFSNFGSGSAVASTAVTQATSDILAALSTAAGVDLTGIDPFGASLVAATTANPDGGNSYDKLLDQLGTVVSAATLPQVVSQIASTTGSSAPMTLDQVVANVAKGSLAGCPQALSGKYRVIDYDGASEEIDLDFGAMKVNGELNIVRNESQNCEFTVNDSVEGVLSTVVISPSGAGVVHDSRIMAYLFPVQSHSSASVQGKWEFLESGINEQQQGEHWVGEMTVAADGSVAVCDYAVMSNSFDSCPVDTEEAVTLHASGDRFILNYGQEATQVFGFRAPNGSLTLFGTSNPLGNTAANFLKTSFVLTRPQTDVGAAVGSVSKYWDITQNFVPPTSTTPYELNTDFATNEVTVTEASATAQTRKRTSDGRIDTYQLNKPIEGMRFRAQGTSNLGQPLSAVYQRFLPGTGMSVYIDGMPGHFAGIAVSRP